MSTQSAPTLPRRIAVTGGIGSGKSYVCQKLQRRGFSIFFCDDEAKRIIRTDAETRQELTRLVGTELYDDEGRLAKSVMAAFLCQGPEHAAKVNAVVHPRVAEAFRRWTAKCADTETIVFMECALLFESGFDALVDLTATVSVDENIRLRRVMERDNISADKARSWMSLQMPEKDKATRANFLLRNNGDERQLDADIDAMISKASEEKNLP